MAAECGNTAALPVLLAAGAAPNGRGDDGRTALYLAVVRQHLRAVELLLQHGADVHSKDIFGDSPYAAALVRGSVEVLDLLLPAPAGPAVGAA